MSSDIFPSIKYYSLGHDVRGHVIEDEQVKVETTRNQAKLRFETKTIRKNKADNL